MAPTEVMLSSPSSTRVALRRVAVSAVAALVAGGAAYGISAVVGMATCETGKCPVGAAPWPLIVVMAAVAAFGAAVGSQPAR